VILRIKGFCPSRFELFVLEFWYDKGRYKKKERQEKEKKER
jgi:hypothetical protein